MCRPAGLKIAGHLRVVAAEWRNHRQWYRDAMRATIDKAGRLVIPKPLRDQLGLGPGEVEVTPDGSGLRVEAIAGAGLVEEGGRLVIPAEGAEVNDELVRALRDADRR